MPNALVKSYAKETGKSEERIERWWKEAEEQALKKFKKSDPRFYAYVNGIVEKRGNLVHGKKRKKRKKTNESLTWEKFQFLSEEYRRVIPRDLFNDGNLLKCYGQLFLNLEKMNMDDALSYDGEAFDIGQTESGDTYIANIMLELGDDIIELHRPINARGAYPLFAINDDGDEIEVFNNNGSFSDDMISLLNTRDQTETDESIGAKITFRQFLEQKH
jgi:hypothetical protein